MPTEKEFPLKFFGNSVQVLDVTKPVIERAIGELGISGAEWSRSVGAIERYSDTAPPGQAVEAWSLILTSAADTDALRLWAENNLNVQR